MEVEKAAQSSSSGDDRYSTSNDESGEQASTTIPAAADEAAQKSRSNLDRHWSLNDGFSGAQDEDEKVPGDEEGDVGIPDESAFTVTWHENDPMNPRNMSTPRRWLIVIIVSLGSVCV